MKAAVLYANDDIRYDEYPMPTVSPGTVIVKVHSAGICGSDIPRVLHNGAHFYPIVLGHEFAGEIVEIGQESAGLAVGDKIAGVPLVPCMTCTSCQKGNYSQCRKYSFIGSREQGSFAQYVKLPVINAVKFDKNISYDQGALFEPSTVALHGLRLCGFTGGGDVAVLGGGTIGIFTTQWAKIMGAKSVTVFDIADDRLDICKKYGADFVVNTLSGTVEKDIYDYVFETAGVTDTMRMAFEIAANRARVCFIGTPTRDLTFTPAQFENMNRKEFTLTGSWMSYSAPFPGDEWTLTAHYFETGQLKFDSNLIFKKIPMCNAAQAFALFKTPGAVKGKILLYND